MRSSAARDERWRTAGTLAAVIFSLVVAGCAEGPPPAACRSDVVTAFRRLQGWPYRRESVVAGSGRAQRASRQISEFLPPDRLRVVEDNGVPGYAQYERIEIGARKWSRQGGRLYELDREEGGDIAAWLGWNAPRDEAFACLGRVEFKGRIYIGYQAPARAFHVSDDSRIEPPAR
jgi:hypothetical protein